MNTKPAPFTGDGMRGDILNHLPLFCVPYTELAGASDGLASKESEITGFFATLDQLRSELQVKDLELEGIEFNVLCGFVGLSVASLVSCCGAFHSPSHGSNVVFGSPC